MEQSILILFIPVVIGMILALVTRKMESKRSSTIQFRVWAITGTIFIVAWLFTK